MRSKREVRRVVYLTVLSLLCLCFKLCGEGGVVAGQVGECLGDGGFGLSGDDDNLMLGGLAFAFASLLPTVISIL